MSINRNLASFAPSINSSGQAAIATITVTVADSKFVMDGTSQQTVSLSKGITYHFDNSDSSNSGHPLAFSTTSDGTHNSGSAFTTGITTVGTAGAEGAYVEVTLEQDAADHLYYYCSNHSGMGGLVKTAPVGNANFASFADTFTFPTSDGSADQVLSTDGSGTLSFATASGGGGSLPTWGTKTTATLAGNSNANLNSSNIVTHSNPGTNKRYQGIIGNYASNDQERALYLSTSADNNIVSGKIWGRMNLPDYDDPMRSDFFGTWSSTNNQFEYNLPSVFTNNRTWGSGEIFRFIVGPFYKYIEGAGRLEFDLVLSGHLQGGFSTTLTTGNGMVVYWEVT